MALGIKQIPDTFSPASNPLPFVVDSSHADENNFKYKVTVQFATETLGVWEDLISMFLYPDVDNGGFMIYDASEVVYNYIEDDSQLVIGTEIVDAGGMKKYRLIVEEYIGATAGDDYTTNNLRTFSGVMQYGEVWEQLPYQIEPVLFLSKISDRIFDLDTYAAINFWNSNVDLTYKVTIINSNTSMWYTSDTAGLDTSILASLPIGVGNINEMATNGQFVGITGIQTYQNIITEDTAYYTIQVFESGTTTAVTEQLRIDVDNKCYNKGVTEFAFQGELGSYENYIAKGRNIKMFKSDTTETYQNSYRLDSADQYVQTIGNRGRNVAKRFTAMSHKVSTDWVYDVDVPKIMELLNSNDAYVIEDGELYPVVITNSSYEEKSVKNDKLFNYIIEYDIANQKNSI